MRAIESETVDGIVFPSLIRASEKKTAKRSSQRRHISAVQISSNETHAACRNKKSPASAALPMPTIPRTPAEISPLWISLALRLHNPDDFCSTNFSASKTDPDRSNNSCASNAIFSSGLLRYPNFSKPPAYIARKNSARSKRHCTTWIIS